MLDESDLQHMRSLSHLQELESVIILEVFLFPSWVVTKPLSNRLNNLSERLKAHFCCQQSSEDQIKDRRELVSSFDDFQT